LSISSDGKGREEVEENTWPTDRRKLHLNMIWTVDEEKKNIEHLEKKADLRTCHDLYH